MGVERVVTQSVAARRRRFAVVTAAVLALGAGTLAVHGASAAGKTQISIKSGEVTAGGDLAVKLYLQCPKGDNNYIYAEADQDVYTNEAAGNEYVNSFICTGKTQKLTVTIVHGRGISHMDYNNDIESDDILTFAPGEVAVLVSVGGQSDFTTQQRTIDVPDDTHITLDSASVDSNGDIAAKVTIECPSGDNDYIYAEADEDSYPNDAAGNVYVPSVTCNGTHQKMTITITHGQGISHMDYNNDQESDDLGPFAPGFTSVLVTMGGDSSFVMQQRTANLH
ncbi:MAG: hypothetical protein JOZ46_10890 [Candidatus Dormibacteraeota bacterium]|nr:hypothetical protein [Candidatus Dormibacteraeota bacterium]MBV9526306.1 hypothetical protein [Candidatus Dormibacteraeota bacterium]